MRKYDFQRTVTTTIAKVIVFDKYTKATGYVDVTLLGKMSKKDKRIIAQANRTIDKENYKVLMCESVSYTEQKFGMKVEDFIKYATPISNEVTEQLEIRYHH